MAPHGPRHFGPGHNPPTPVRPPGPSAVSADDREDSFLLYDSTDVWDNSTDTYDGSPAAFVVAGLDTAGGTDTVTSKVTQSRAVSDAESGTDAASRSDRYARTGSDTAAAIDTAAAHITVARSGTDVAPATDATARIVRLARFGRQIVAEAPASILDLVNMVPNDVSYITDNPDSPDTQWILSNEIAQPCSIRIKLATPHNSPTGLQEFRVRLRPSQ